MCKIYLAPQIMSLLAKLNGCANSVAKSVAVWLP